MELAVRLSLQAPYTSEEPEAAIARKGLEVSKAARHRKGGNSWLYSRHAAGVPDLTGPVIHWPITFGVLAYRQTDWHCQVFYGASLLMLAEHVPAEEGLADCKTRGNPLMRDRSAGCIIRCPSSLSLSPCPPKVDMRCIVFESKHTIACDGG